MRLKESFIESDVEIIMFGTVIVDAYRQSEIGEMAAAIEDICTIEF